jgi:hypothetical protein
VTACGHQPLPELEDDQTDRRREKKKKKKKKKKGEGHRRRGSPQRDVVRILRPHPPLSPPTGQHGTQDTRGEKKEKGKGKGKGKGKETWLSWTEEEQGGVVEGRRGLSRSGVRGRRTGGRVCMW